MLLPPRCGPVVAWGNALLVAACSPDDADAGIRGVGAAHRVVGVPGEPGPTTWAVALGRLRALGTCRLRLVLPVPGDLRGVPGPPAVAAAAVQTGEAVVTVGGPPLLILPVGPPEGPGPDAGPLVRWTAHPVGPAGGGTMPGGSSPGGSSAAGAWSPAAGAWSPAATGGPSGGPLGSGPPGAGAGGAETVGSVRAAERDLRRVLREVTEDLAALGLDRPRPGVADAVAAAERRTARDALPATVPPSALALLRTAVRLAAVLDLAVADDGGAVTAGEAARRRTALAPLRTAVRAALEAAYGAVDTAGPAGSDGRQGGRPR